MSDNNEPIYVSYDLIRKDFGLGDDSPSGAEQISYEWLESRLTQQIKKMLDRDLNRLLNILYRIDVSEERIKHILTTEAPDTMARSIAKMVIDRQLQKASTRIKYRQS